jgi:hypothetical protein
MNEMMPSSDRLFGERKDRSSPFQKLALCPTNFSTEFEEVPRTDRKVVQHLRVKSGDVGQELLRKS